MHQNPVDLSNPEKADIANLRHIANLLHTVISVIDDPRCFQGCNPQGIKEISQDVKKARIATLNELSRLGDKVSYDFTA